MRVTDAGFTGARCEGRVAALSLDQGIGGTLGQGAWSFFTLDLTRTKSWRKVCSMVAGTASLCSDCSAWPSLGHRWGGI